MMKTAPQRNKHHSAELSKEKEMNYSIPKPGSLTLLTAALASLGFSSAIQAAATDLSDVPLAEASTVTVLPNIFSYWMTLGVWLGIICLITSKVHP